MTCTYTPRKIKTLSAKREAELIDKVILNLAIIASIGTERGKARLMAKLVDLAGESTSE